MKKNVLFGLLAMMLLFCFTACGDDTGGGGDIPVLVKAYNNNGTAPVSLSMARAVGGGRGGLLRDFTTDTASFAPFDGTYNNLGTPEETYTPTQFNLWYEISALMPDGSNYIIAPNQQYDFVKGLTVDIGDVPPDITVSGLVINFARADHEDNPVSFTTNDGTKTVDVWNLARVPSDQPGVDTFLTTFVCYGDTRKFIPMGEDALGPNNSNINGGVAACIFIPFEPKVISADASSVTLNISWNLTNIVGKYNLYADNGPLAVLNYRFVKGWWDNLYVYASVQ